MSMFVHISCAFHRPGEDSVPVSSEPLFLTRVLGQRFSFYSTHMSISFLKFMRDYEDQDKQEMQIVYQLTRLVTSTSTSSSTAASMQVHFLFAVPADREFIIYILDSMLQILRVSANPPAPQQMNHVTLPLSCSVYT